jgi:hypothetical protein
MTDLVRSEPGRWIDSPVRVLAALALLWLILSLWQFELPGLQMDEVNHLAFIPGVKSAEAAHQPHFRLPDNLLDHRKPPQRYPILGGSVYNSTISTWLGLPYFALAGHSVGSVRIFWGLLGLAGAIALTSLVGRIFGWPAALAAGLVLMSDPTHLISIRSQANLFWLVVLFIGLAGHALLSLSRHHQPPIWLAFLAGVCLGMSVAAYFVGSFLAVPLGLVGLYLLRKRPLAWLAFLGGGLIAYSPVLYALASIYLINPAILANLGMPDWAARESIPVLSLNNLSRLVTITTGAFGSHTFATSIAGSVKPDLTGLRMILYAILVAVTLWTLTRRDEHTRRAWFVSITAMLLVYFSALFLLKATSVHHLVPLTLLAALLCGSLIGLDDVRRWIGSSLCLLLVVTNLIVAHAIFQRLGETGGQGYHNEYHTHIATTLTGPLANHHPVFTTWGFHLQFLFLTDGQHPYTYLGDADHERIENLLRDHRSLALIVRSHDRQIILDRFHPDHELVYSQRNGVELFRIMLLSTTQSTP